MRNAWGSHRARKDPQQGALGAVALGQWLSGRQLSGVATSGAGEVDEWTGGPGQARLSGSGRGGHGARRLSGGSALHALRDESGLAELLIHGLGGQEAAGWGGRRGVAGGGRRWRPGDGTPAASPGRG